MRKLLLATTALASFAISGAAQAATSPLSVNVGGTVDFLAANYASSNHGVALQSTHRDFETVYGLNFGIDGKGNNGVEYGGVLSLSNASDTSNGFAGTQTSPYLSAGYVFLKGAFGKVQLGDSHGATDLSILAPVAGEGQVYGHYIDFIDTSTFAKTLITSIDVTDHSTNVTYFTPKVGDANHKVQAAVSYVPQLYQFSDKTIQTNGTTGTGNSNSPYHDVVKAAVAYEANYNPVAFKASANVINGSTSSQAGAAWVSNVTGQVKSFTSYGFGTQAAFDGFTLGGSYTDFGHYDAVDVQTKNQRQYTAGLTYAFSKVMVGVSYLGGEGYDNMLTNASAGGVGSSQNYIKSFNTVGAGGSYTWAPGLTSNLDGVYFNQKSDASVDNKGYVLLVSQKLAF